MKVRPTEEIMGERRADRLRQLTFFMTDPRFPEGGRRVWALSATHNLLTGFFENSHWRTAWFCVREAAINSWQTFAVDVRFFYWRNILRLDEQQIGQRILGYDE